VVAVGGAERGDALDDPALAVGCARDDGQVLVFDEDVGLIVEGALDGG
jgi:hypothetical protein